MKIFLTKKTIFYLFILISIFFQQAEVKCATFEADYIPWSGYWWPKVHGGLVTGWDYQGHPAPFEKYDYVISGAYNGDATRYGRGKHYDKEALMWEGLCFCWAIASIMEEEPIHKGLYKGTIFHIGDKKGLLTALYYGAMVDEYSTSEPTDFHGILENFIAHQKTPIIMDLGTGGESWNYPVFKYDTDYTQDGNIRHYKTTIYYVRDEVEPDFIGSLISKRNFYYYFILDEEGNITESNWENETIPPVAAYEPLGTEPLNPGLDYDTVKEIAYTYDDSYEENNTSEAASALSTGRYTLIAIDSDYFKVELKKNNSVSIRVEPDEKDAVWLKTYTPTGELIQETQGSGEQVISVNDEQSEGTYFIEVTPLKPTEEPVYELSLELSLSYQGIFPLHLPGQWQSGIALLTPDKDSSTTNRTIISVINNNGSAENSYTDTTSLPHLLGTLGKIFKFPAPVGTEYIRVDSDMPFMGLQSLISENFNLMLGGNFILLDNASEELFFPHFATTGGWTTGFGIINTGDQTEEIFLQSYDLNGNTLLSDTLELDPGQKWEKEDASYFGIVNSNTKSMSATTVSGKNALIGYMTFLNPTIGHKGRAFVPIPLESGSELVIPHVAADAYWWTGVAVMNTGDDDSNVIFTGYDAEGKQIAELEYLIKAKQNFVKEASTIFSGLIQGKSIASIKILSQNNQPLCGFLLYGTIDNLRLAGVPLRPASPSPHYVAHVPTSASWWTGIGLTNAGDRSADISFSLFDNTGGLISDSKYHLNPNQRLVSLVNDLFDNNNISGSYLKIESEQPISGIYLIGSENGTQLMGDGF